MVVDTIVDGGAEVVGVGGVVCWLRQPDEKTRTVRRRKVIVLFVFVTVCRLRFGGTIYFNCLFV